MKPLFFRTGAEFGAWLERNHDSASELWVGYYKKSSGKPSMGWSEAVDQALRFGWIDGVRRTIDEESYANRFTPRRKGSTWSSRNIERVKELMNLGLMHPAGIRAFEARREDRSSIYSYEQRHLVKLDPRYEHKFRRDRKAWTEFQSMAPSYRQTAIFWVMSAKREETRERRLANLIEQSAAGRKVGPLARPGPDGDRRQRR